MAAPCTQAVVIFSLCVLSVSGIRFYLEPGQRRCFTEELPTLTKITGEAVVTSGKSDMSIDVWITTMSGTVLFHKRAPDHGLFSFMTPAASEHEEDDEDEYMYHDEAEEDTYKICIEHQQPPSRAHPLGTKRLVSFKLHQAFDGSKGSANSAASATDTDKLQTTMRSMHTTLSGMIGDLSQLQRNERTLLNRMKRTTSRLTFLSILSLIIILSTGALQFRYYKGYFKQKKLC